MAFRQSHFEFLRTVNYRTEILAGITVALALIPEALAFSIIAGVPPSTGLYAAFVVGLVTAVFGGRPGMISGATGAVAVGLASLSKTYGPEYIFPAVILAGLIQIIVGILRLNRLIRFVSAPVMLGFVNGLAIIIFLSQLVQFKGDVNGHAEWLSGAPLYTMIGLVGLTILLMVLLPKMMKGIPAALTTIVIVFLVVACFGIPTKTVGDIGSIHGGFPPFHIADVPFSLETLKIIFPYALIMAGVALIESLLTLNLISEMTGTEGNGRRDTIAQGAANVLSGLFSGMGGCAMVGQSLVNMSAGGRGRLSGIIAAVTLLVFIMFGASLIEKVPMAALTGIMIMVAVNTFKWDSLTPGKMPVYDLFVIILVAAITVISHNLALAVLIGVIVRLGKIDNSSGNGA